MSIIRFNALQETLNRSHIKLLESKKDPLFGKNVFNKMLCSNI